MPPYYLEIVHRASLQHEKAITPQMIRQLKASIQPYTITTAMEFTRVGWYQDHFGC